MVPRTRHVSVLSTVNVLPVLPVLPVLVALLALVGACVVGGPLAAQASSGTAVGAAAPTGAAAGGAGGTYVPVAPSRLLDTRYAVGRPGASPVAPGGSVEVTAVSVGELPATGVGAVAVTLTAVGGTAAGYLSAFPADVTDPGTSTLNWLKGQIVANATVVAVAPDGRFVVRNASLGATHVLVDVTGYWLSGKPGTGGSLSATTPTRVLDTRRGVGVHGSRPLPDRATITVPVADRGGVAAGAASVVLNLTVTEPTTGGFATVGGPLALPIGGSALNWAPRQTVANLVVAAVAPDGTVTLSVTTGGGTAHLVADLVAFVTAGPLSQVGTISAQRPYRLVDTRTGATPRPVPAQGTLVVDPTSGPRPLAPGDASAVVVDLVVTSATAAGFLTAYPSGRPAPTTSVLNWGAGQTVAAAVVVPVGPDGTFSLRLGSAGSAHVVVDLEGVVLGRPVVEATGWSVDQVPGTDLGAGAASGVDDVDCADGPRCAVLGRSVDADGVSSTTVRRWDGASWGATAGLPPGDPGRGGVACTGSGTCAAVVPHDGSSRVATSGETGPWTVEAPPVDADGRPAVVGDVDCAPTGATCLAVGRAVAPGASTAVPYAALWSGGTWRATPVPFTGASGQLLSVVCTADTACTAVGGQESGGSTSPVASSWDGAAWTTETLTVPGAGGWATARQVAARGGDVVATGTTGATGATASGGFVAVRSGSTWTTTAVDAPVPGTASASFTGTSLACDAGACFAATSTGLASVPDVADVAVTTASGTGATPLTSLSCSTTWCVGTSPMALHAVGDRGVVLDRVGGTWTAAVAPSPVDAIEGGLDGRVPVTARVGCWSSGCLLLAPYAARSGGQPLKAAVLLRSPCVTTCVAPRA